MRYAGKEADFQPAEGEPLYGLDKVHKMCSRCNRWLPLYAFPRNSRGRGYLDYKCKQCKTPNGWQPWYRPERAGHRNGRRLARFDALEEVA